MISLEISAYIKTVNSKGPNLDKREGECTEADYPLWYDGLLIDADAKHAGSTHSVFAKMTFTKYTHIPSKSC